MKTRLLFFLSALQLCAGAKILAIVPVPTKSHHYVLERLVIELTKKGHDVTFVTPYKQPQPIPRLKEIIIPDMYQEIMKMMAQDSDQTSNFNKMRKVFGWMWPIVGLTTGPPLSDAILSTSQMQELMRSEEKFDVIMGEMTFAEPVLAGLSHKFKAPIIGMSPYMPNYYPMHLVGNPAPSSYIPDSILALPKRMTFWERLENTLYNAFMEISYQFLYITKQDDVMRKHFRDDLPPLDDIIKNTSLVLVNHHFSLAFPRPNLPNMVEVGGFHVQPAKPLPADLQKYFDESKEGVILFSMGSHLKSTELPKEKKEAILNAFSRIKQNVLWKFEDDTLTNIPKNVKISKWLPQSDILTHPNLKLFITHGGLFSTTEAVKWGVPVVGIPVGGDQYTNMKYTTEAGFGVYLEIDDLNEDVLYRTINEVLNNPKYRENVKRGSSLFNDRPLPPMDTAIYWVEYVIRHKGAPHLRSAAQDLAWHQLHLLDVLGFIFLVSSSVIYINFRVVKFVLKKLFCRKSGQVSKGKKQN